MKYILIVLLFAGCSSTPQVKKLSPEAQAKRDAEIARNCDFMIGPPRNSPDYIHCMEIVAAEMK